MAPATLNDQRAIQGAIEWALLHGFSLKTGPGSASHCAFSLAPTLIDQQRFTSLKQDAPLVARLIHRVSEDHDFIQQAMTPIAGADPFFKQLLDLHKTIHGDRSLRSNGAETKTAHRIPLLFMRTDFMDDAELGPRVIEFNGIAAGMGPFGQRAHELHSYLQTQFTDTFQRWSPADNLKLLDNPAIERLSAGLEKAARQVRDSFDESGKPVFLMVVQPDEDNVYDQHLLEMALQARGVRTVRRTFRELHDQLSTGDDYRLIMEGIGGIDCIYLRAGYQHEDYCSTDLLENECCAALTTTRAFMELHRVAINATIGQQLATCKRIQMLLTAMSTHELTAFGLSHNEAERVQSLLGDMRPVNEQSLSWFAHEAPQNWVLKNQGEGGGHCVFDKDILPRLKTMKPEDYSAWALMRRLHPAPRPRPALLLRRGQEMVVNDLISELGLFTVHIDGEPATDEQGYAGYLIRSKPASVEEGGVHSGLGAADSLAVLAE